VEFVVCIVCEVIECDLSVGGWFVLWGWWLVGEVFL